MYNGYMYMYVQQKVLLYRVQGFNGKCRIDMLINNATAFYLIYRHNEKGLKFLLTMNKDSIKLLLTMKKVLLTMKKDSSYC